jgi:amidase
MDAFWEYERALMANDLVALDRLFAPGPDTVRGDAGGILIGHDTISAFRNGRGGAPKRTVLEVIVRHIDDDNAVVIAVTSPATGGRGQQTQVWNRSAGSWVVTAAHVSSPVPAIAAATWRVVGSPLVSGATSGALVGRSVAVKDLFEVEGFAVGAGVPAYLAEQSPAAGTAAAVSALLAAGASVTGIAQTDEFAYSIAGKNMHYGTPPNPAVPGAIPGGSSSGPASAVATGQVDIGLGTDTGGSIRVPASYNGLWGLRPTHGAVSRSGLLPLAPSFDTVGWLARDAATLAAAAATGLDGAAQTPLGTEFVVAPALLSLLSPEVRDVYSAAIDALSSDAASPDAVSFDAVSPDAVSFDAVEVDLGDLDELFEAFRMTQASEAWASWGSWVTAHPGALGDDIAGRFAFASAITEQQALDAAAAWDDARARLDALLGDRVLVLSSASSVAPSTTASAAEIEVVRAGTLRLTCIAGITGRPGLSVPALSVRRATSATPLPVGLRLVGPRFSDLALIGLGEQLAARLAGRLRLR